MPAATPSPAPAQPRLLSGGGRSRTGGGTESFPATLPLNRPPAAPAAPARPQPTPWLPRWARGVVIAGLLLAVGMPAAVLMSRSMLVQAALTEHSSSKAAMICTAGQARAVDGSSLSGWLFGGSYFSCGDWETREARQQRERDLAHEQYMARQKARQGY